MVTLGEGTGNLEIQLCGQPLADCDVAQNKVGRVISLGEAGCRPLWHVDVGGARQRLASAAGQGGREVGIVVSDMACLIGARHGSVPGEPSGCENMLAADQQAANNVIGAAL